MTPTQRTLKKLRDEGWLCAVVEKWNPAVKQRHDLFGLVDVLGIRDGETIAVQTTSGSNVAARLRKIADHENTARIRTAGWSFHVHGWRKLKSSRRWECRVVDVS